MIYQLFWKLLWKPGCWKIILLEILSKQLVIVCFLYFMQVTIVYIDFSHGLSRFHWLLFTIIILKFSSLQTICDQLHSTMKRRIQNPIKHVRWSFSENIQRLWAVNYINSKNSILEIWLAYECASVLLLNRYWKIMVCDSQSLFTKKTAIGMLQLISE